jgi:hypothetical protein
MLFFIMLILLLSSLAASQRYIEFVIDWSAIGPSSANLHQDGIELHGVIGQGIAGQVSQPEVNLCSGYLCIFTQWLHRLFLPLINR